MQYDQVADGRPYFLTKFPEAHLDSRILLTYQTLENVSKYGRDILVKNRISK